MKPFRVLIVEDEPKVASFIRQGLEESRYETDIAYDGPSGLEMALKGNYQVVVLDVNLPVMNGYEVCNRIRISKPDIPVLMLTALGSTEDKLNGFESGADDYLVKPFEFVEFLARVKALLKRAERARIAHQVMKIDDLTLNSDTKEVRRGERKIELTAKEFALLEYLMRNRERVVSRAEIAEKIWEITFDTGTNVIDVYINFLRKKIEGEGHKKLIHTLIGMGYVLKDS